ncbi:MAG: hypothetical protein AAFR76_07305 [Planctomycetota bacterium]
MNDHAIQNSTGKEGLESVIAGVASYRVAQDLSGDWWVWRRTSNTTWTTFRRCETEAEARIVCDELNAAV